MSTVYSMFNNKNKKSEADILDKIKAWGSTALDRVKNAGGKLYERLMKDVKEYNEKQNSASEAYGTVQPTETVQPSETEKKSEYLKNAEAEAYKAYERALIDADTQYKKALSGYGANAEQLASMGLSGSGYSDYLSSQAYAAAQGARASATSDYNTAVREAAYQDYVNKQAEKEKQEAAEETNRSYWQSIYNSIISGELTTAEQVNALASRYALSEEDRTALINELSSRNSASYKQAFEYGDASISDIESAYATGNLSEQDYQAMRSDYSDNFSVDEFFSPDGSLLTKSAAEEALKNALKFSWISETDKKALQNKFNETYKLTFNRGNDDYFYTKEANFGEMSNEGDNYYIHDSNKTYLVQSGGECTDALVKELAKDVTEGTVFGFDGKVYIKGDGDKVYNVNQVGNGNQYRDLKKALFGNS